MAVYFKLHSIPTWIILHPGAKYEATKKFLLKAGGVFQPDFALTFKDTLMECAKRGWEDRVKPGSVIPDQLIHTAFIKHLQKNCIESAQVNYPANQIARMDRKLETTEDYARIFNDLLTLVEPIQLSYLIQVQERFLNPKDPKKCILTDYGFNLKIVTSLATKIIQIGYGSQYDIDMTDAPKSVSSFLETKLTALIGAQK